MRNQYTTMKSILNIKMRELAYNPGYYLVLFLGLLTIYFLSMNFADSVDSSGFNYNLSPFYSFFIQTFEGSMGLLFAKKILYGGPFLLSLYIAYLPVFIFISVSSIYRLGFEKNTGVIEFICYGPIEPGLYYLSVFIRDCIFFLISVFSIIIYIVITALLNNFALGPQIWYSCGLLLLTTASFSAFSILISALMNNGISAVFLYSGTITIFSILAVVNHLVIDRYVAQFYIKVINAVRWISPIFYWEIGIKSFSSGLYLYAIIAYFPIILLIIITLIICRIIMKKKSLHL